MTDNKTTVFAGLDGRTDTDLPTWYRTLKNDPETVSFAEAIRALPRAVTTTVAYQNPFSSEWVETDRFTALAEPTRLVQHASGDSVEPLFHIPTDSYAVINPVDIYAPLEAALREAAIDDRSLGEVVFGEIRQYRDGGEVHMDVLFDGLSVTLPGRHEPITMGVTSGYDYFGGNAVYVEGFARDTYCANSIRALTDRKVVKHVGEVGDFDAWWHGVLTQLELVGDDLYNFIRDAQEITVDFTAVPFGLTEFYTLLGFPTYLAKQAASDVRAEADDPLDIDMWTLHAGATYALTHFFTGKEGASLDGYVRVANDVLFNPERVVARVERTYREQATGDTRDGQTGLESQVALAQVERIGRDVREKATQFEAREATLRERFTAL